MAYNHNALLGERLLELREDVFDKRPHTGFVKITFHFVQKQQIGFLIGGDQLS